MSEIRDMTNEQQINRMINGMIEINAVSLHYHLFDKDPKMVEMLADVLNGISNVLDHLEFKKHMEENNS